MPNISLDFFYGRTILDEKHKLILVFTPRAGCTLACSIFFQHMEVYQNIPNKLREMYNNPENGPLFLHKYRVTHRPVCTQNKFKNSKYTKIKFVRNPYYRAVSSYLFSMHRFPNIRKMSFLDFLQELKPGSILPKNASSHSKLQFDNITEEYIDHIVKIENLESDLTEIDQKYKTKLLLAYQKLNSDDITVSHKSNKNNEIKNFIGNLSYDELISRFGNPIANYKYYYNQDSKALVENIYIQDIQEYGYDFDLHIESIPTRISCKPKIYAVGRRCNSVEFLQKFNLYSDTSPFDWDVCDLTTVIMFIKLQFHLYNYDLYNPWTGQIINPKNFKTGPDQPKVSYLNIKVRNHKHLCINLNTVQIKDDYNIYSDREGLYIFHYNMNLQDNLEKKNRRINRFLQQDKDQIWLLHMLNMIEEDQLQVEKDYVCNLIKQVKYRFILLFPIVNYSKPTNSEIVQSHIFVYFSVPSLQEQLTEKIQGKSPPGNDNNINDPRINWLKVSEHIKSKI